MNKNINNRVVGFTQLLVWLTILLVPAAIEWFGHGYHWDATIGILSVSSGFLLPGVIIYFFNFYLLAPRLFNKQYAAFFGGNLVVLAIYVTVQTLAGLHVVKTGAIDLPIWILIVFGTTFYNTLFVGCSVGVRYIIHWNEVQRKQLEQQHKYSEAELAWLKNQLNPHFLFNTLNNISSLIQIDPDEAQERISQLSDLLRYALYDTNQPFVPLADEIAFMNNYIELMQLRYSNKVKITVQFNPPSTAVEIPPLLYISLIENAFKHGVSGNHPSFISIHLEAKQQNLVFTIQNSYYPKAENNHSGSGIGIENLKRRLQLLYPNRHLFAHEKIEDTYLSQVTLLNCIPHDTDLPNH